MANYDVVLYDLMNVYLGYAQNTLTTIDEDNLDIIKKTIIGNSPELITDKSKISELVYKFICDNIMHVIYKIIKIGDGYKASLFQTNIKRIENCIGYNFLNEEKVHIQLLKIFISLTHEKFQSKYQQEMIKHIILYINNIAINHLNNLFIVAIKHKQYGIIDKLKYHVDIEKFLDKTKLGKRKNINIILQTKGHKLFELLINEYNYDI